MAKAESLGQGRSWIWNPYRDPEQIKPELTSQFPILPWWLHGAAPPPDSLGHWEAEDGEALVPVLSIDSVGALFKIWIKIIQGDSILAQVLDQLFSSVPSLHGLARGYGEEHLAEAHIETCTPIPSQPSAPAQIWKCLFTLKAAPSLSEALLPPLGCVLSCLQHLPSVCPWHSSNDKFISPSANTSPEEHCWGLSAAAWRVAKGKERFLLTRTKNKPKPPNLTWQNKNSPNKYLVVRTAF